MRARWNRELSRGVHGARVGGDVAMENGRERELRVETSVGGIQVRCGEEALVGSMRR